MNKHPAIPTHVFEICKRLKPFLGNQIDRVLQVYLAEDKEGRKELESHIELLSAKYLTSALSSQTQLVPPNEEQAQGEYKIGEVMYEGKKMCDFGLRENEWIQHVAILGRTGAGKTNSGFQILKELKRKGKPVLILDWKKNYRDLLALPEFKDIKVYTPGKNVAPFHFNPLIPPPGTDPKTWLKKLNEIIAHAYLLGDGALYILQQSLDTAYDEAGIYDGTVRKWPTIKDVLIKAQKLNCKGRESGWLSSTLRALASMCFGNMGELIARQGDNLAALLDKTVILELDGLTQQDKVFFMEAMLLWIHHYRMSESGREKFKHAILIEEAHHILSNERGSLVGGQSVMEIMFREIREFGEALILSTQHPSKLSVPALGNTYTTFCLNLKHSKDVNAMAGSMLLDGDEKDILGQAEVGQTVVKLQGRISQPFLIHVPEFKIEKGKITDDMVREGMSIPNPNQTEEAPVPIPETISRKEDSSETKFLKDVRDNPDSGIAARYKRLGISVRQGQKLKAYLCAEGLLDEEEARTPTGKTIQLNLTEKGESSLAAA